MIVYTAAPWVNRVAARELRTKLQAQGHVVVSRWLDFVGEASIPAEPGSRDAKVLHAEAIHDFEDIDKADVLVVLNSTLSEGKAVEQGYAMAFDMPIIAIGVPSNVFHYIDEIYTWVPDVEGALAVLAGMEKAVNSVPF